MTAKEFYIDRELEKNPDLGDMIIDHADDMEDIFEIMEEYAEYVIENTPH